MFWVRRRALRLDRSQRQYFTFPGLPKEVEDAIAFLELPPGTTSCICVFPDGLPIFPWAYIRTVQANSNSNSKPCKKTWRDMLKTSWLRDNYWEQVGLLDCSFSGKAALWVNKACMCRPCQGKLRRISGYMPLNSVCMWDVKNTSGSSGERQILASAGKSLLSDGTGTCILGVVTITVLLLLGKRTTASKYSHVPVMNSF